MLHMIIYNDNLSSKTGRPARRNTNKGGGGLWTGGGRCMVRSTGSERPFAWCVGCESIKSHMLVYGDVFIIH